MLARHEAGDGANSAKRESWLWKQSAANRSLGSKFPANRQMNSELRRSSTPKAFQIAAKHLRLLPYRLNMHCKELGNSYRVNSEYLR